jgi:CheY-like chemotaxis protein
MNKAFELLMIEDNPSDIRLSQEYLKESKLSNHLTVVKNLMDALSYLRDHSQYAPATLPDIILISIRIIWMNDKGLLIQIKNDAALKDIPVVILTAFEGEEASLDDDLVDILCVSKPLNLDCLVAIVKHIGDFGLTIEWTTSALKHNGLKPSSDEISYPFSFQST